jgi:uncharacterized membrane protein YdcZ (DUF606 family)
MMDRHPNLTKLIMGLIRFVVGVILLFIGHILWDMLGGFSDPWWMWIVSIIGFLLLIEGIYILLPDGPALKIYKLFERNDDGLR